MPTTNPFSVHSLTTSTYLQWIKANSIPEDNALFTFTWKGNDYSCNFKWTQIKYLDAGGYVPQDALILEVLEPMPDAPQLEDLVTFLDKQFRIMQIDLAQGKPPRLVCYDPARGS